MTDSHYPHLEGEGGTCVSCLHSKPGTSLAHAYTHQHRQNSTGTRNQSPVDQVGRPITQSLLATNMRKTLPLTSLPVQREWVKVADRQAPWHLTSLPTVPAQLGGKHQWLQQLLGPHLD